MRNFFINFVADFWADLILYADTRPNLAEKTVIVGKLLFLSAPITYFLKQFNQWFTNNHEFVSFTLYAILFNVAIGIYYHLKKKTFSWRDFLVKNIEMFGIIIVVYFMLEMINVVAAKSITGEYFQMLIQLLTLLYPISKALKNVHILSNYKHPPHFIMNRLYQFNKDGDVGELFKGKKDDKKDKH